nr:immunoglobulin heavy chain junction region [Mus musculus]MBK4184043.1 immunoglobulin heavy chain junction region [Mus musculus]MBK4184046.1 immunoglobulin heavy chain junction region [Mus musculus]MBK4184047.1 immunoglobulin heavy chain junction region [Mus musculus]MBK4190153.1 immunoglobulin heavy chain junction region [Mus musculus]
CARRYYYGSSPYWYFDVW